MESFDLTKLSLGEKLLITTETGSTYHFKAETTPVPVNEDGSIFRGLRATRESAHNLDGRPEAIENDPALLFVGSEEPGSVLQAGDAMQIDWDRTHPTSKEWDMQFGPLFHKFTTSRIIGIELVPVEDN